MLSSMPIIVQLTISHQDHPISRPYSSRSSLLRLLRPILAPTRRSIPHTTQIHRPPNQMIPHTGTILTPSPPNQHNTMLLHIMTLPGYVGSNHSARTQSHSCHFSFRGIRFL